jgi:dihydrofolate synthase/folylpolyglutamate synthase
MKNVVENDFEKAVSYVHSLADIRLDPSLPLGLDRFVALCERLGNPHDKLRIVHIGGTNGKGSTTAMVSSILRAAGYKVGTYYSPYVYNIRERVQLNGSLISEEDFVRIINIIKPEATALAKTTFGHPTEFEVKTALGLFYFAEQQVDFAVLEVGMGGRLDATNVVNPLVSVITNVGLDHLERLGNTIAKIAREKAGIVKQNGHLVTAAEHPEALKVIRQTCTERNCVMWRVYRADETISTFKIKPFDKATDLEHIEKPSAVPYTPFFHVEGMNACYPNLTLQMQGEFQQLNAATAIGAIEVLQRKGIEISESAIRLGLEKAYIPGRLEILQTKPTLLIDGAHNPDGAKILAKALKTCFTYNRLILVMGMVSGHSVADTVGILAPLAHRFYATAPNCTRAVPPLDIAKAATPYCAEIYQAEPVAEAVRLALESADESDLVCVTGSFYTIGEVPRPSRPL